MKNNQKREDQEKQEKETESLFEKQEQMAENSVDEVASEANNKVEGSEKEKLQKVEAEIHELSDKYLRLVAEFDNFRKRTARDRNELVKNAGEDLIKLLLDVLDDADRAETQLKKTNDMDSFRTGIELIFNKLRNILSSKGLKKMKAKGDEFNPELHEAITEIPAPTKNDSGKVLDEVQTGYYLNDKIIRHAKVVVGK